MPSPECTVGWHGLWRLYMTSWARQIGSGGMVLAALAACGPVSLAQAERQCFERARLAERPRGAVVIGIDSGGRVGGGVELDISGDYLRGRDPAAVYDSCVVARSGEPPSQPLYARPDWRG